MKASLKSLLLGVSAATLIVSGALAQEKRVLTYNADYDPIPLAAMEALIADFERPIRTSTSRSTISTTKATRPPSATS